MSKRPNERDVWDEDWDMTCREIMWWTFLPLLFFSLPLNNNSTLFHSAAVTFADFFRVYKYDMSEKGTSISRQTNYFLCINCLYFFFCECRKWNSLLAAVCIILLDFLWLIDLYCWWCYFLWYIFLLSIMLEKICRLMVNEEVNYLIY